MTLVNPAPNGTTGITPQPTCSIWANDTDGDTLTVYWYENSTGNYVLRATYNNNVTANTTTSYTFSEFSSYSVTYYWKVAVNDSKDNVTAWYSFTTAANNPSTFSNEAPTNESINVAKTTTTINVTIEDPDGNTFNSSPLATRQY
jgi:hypothetical protein